MLRLCLNGSALASRRITEAGAIALNQITLDQNLVGENPNPSAAGGDPIAILTWVLAYERGNGSDAAMIKEMFNVMLSTEGQNVTPRLGFVPQRVDILTKSKAAINENGE